MRRPDGRKALKSILSVGNTASPSVLQRTKQDVVVDFQIKSARFFATTIQGAQKASEERVKMTGLGSDLKTNIC